MTSINGFFRSVGLVLKENRTLYGLIDLTSLFLLCFRTRHCLLYLTKVEVDFPFEKKRPDSTGFNFILGQ